MRIPLDRDGRVPLYQQIEKHLRRGILDGRLAAGTRLPASRELAQALGVSRITVENAYADLEAEGLLASRVGSGTYVLPPAPAPLPRSDGPRSWPLWQQSLSGLDGPMPLAPDALLEAAGHRHPISFAGGTGDPALFPADPFRKTIHEVMRRDGIAAFEYGDFGGYAPLRSTVARILSSQGLQADPENILITSGSQQGLSLVTRLLLRAGDTVLVESPTYGGALDLFKAAGLRIVTIGTDSEGMQAEKLESLLQQHHPGLIYTIPNFHNPTGACMSGFRRRQLVSLAGRYNVPVLEDDYVGDLRYDGRAQPALKSLDPGGRVIYASTFSKMLLPGLRVGFLVAEGPVYAGLAHAKRVHDLATSSLMQRAVEAYVTVGRYQAHLRRSCQLYRRRRDAMLQALGRYLPSGIHFDPPRGGLFVWLGLPEGVSAGRLLEAAVRQGVAFAPGTGFFSEDSNGDRFIRLNFAAHPPETIEEGVKRLRKALLNESK